MNPKALIPLFVVGLACCTIGHAGVTDFSYTSDYTNFNCRNVTLSYNLDRTEVTVGMGAHQYRNSTGLMGGTTHTDSPDAVSLILNGSVNNDTSTAWKGYDIRIFMDRAFSLSNVGVGPVPPDWRRARMGSSRLPRRGVRAALAATFAILLAPSLALAHPLGNFTINHYAGIRVAADAGQFQFNYTLNFSGGSQYSFTDQVTPIPVPEPGIMALALLGGLALAGRKWHRP